CIILEILYNNVNITVYFFFSSRRRHTRSKRDWSSDVCSSDLYGQQNTSQMATTKDFILIYAKNKKHLQLNRTNLSSSQLKSYKRSEERRVGKECRSWWSMYQ